MSMRGASTFFGLNELIYEIFGAHEGGNAPPAAAGPVDPYFRLINTEPQADYYKGVIYTFVFIRLYA